MQGTAQPAHPSGHRPRLQAGPCQQLLAEPRQQLLAGLRQPLRAGHPLLTLAEYRAVKLRQEEPVAMPLIHHVAGVPPPALSIRQVHPAALLPAVPIPVRAAQAQAAAMYLRRSVPLRIQALVPAPRAAAVRQRQTELPVPSIRALPVADTAPAAFLQEAFLQAAVHVRPVPAAVVAEAQEAAADDTGET